MKPPLESGFDDPTLPSRPEGQRAPCPEGGSNAAPPSGLAAGLVDEMAEIAEQLNRAGYLCTRCGLHTQDPYRMAAHDCKPPEPPKAFDHDWTDEPVCPHCGKEQSDAWEWGQDDDGETDCSACGREFSYTRHISVNWTTRKDIACHSCHGSGRMPSGKTCLVCSGSRRKPNDKP